MNPADDNLSQALRELADDSPRGAPPELGLRVKTAFARHHARRQRNRIAFAGALAACLLLSLAWWRTSQPARPEIKAAQAPQAIQPAVAAHVAEEPSKGRVAAAVIPEHAREQARTKAVKVRGSKRTEPPVEIAADDFVALPMFDPAVTLGQSRMVRLEMPGSALQLIGYPVNEELLERRVLTDVLVGQDGVPYAVRLVQTRSSQ